MVMSGGQQWRSVSGARRWTRCERLQVTSDAELRDEEHRPQQRQEDKHDQCRRDKKEGFSPERFWPKDQMQRGRPYGDQTVHESFAGTLWLDDRFQRWCGAPVLVQSRGPVFRDCCRLGRPRAHWNESGWTIDEVWREQRWPDSLDFSTGFFGDSGTDRKSAELLPNRFASATKFAQCLDSSARGLPLKLARDSLGFDGFEQ